MKYLILITMMFPFMLDNLHGSTTTRSHAQKKHPVAHKQTIKSPHIPTNRAVRGKTNQAGFLNNNQVVVLKKLQQTQAIAGKKLNIIDKGIKRISQGETKTNNQIIKELKIILLKIETINKKLDALQSILQNSAVASATSGDDLSSVDNNLNGNDLGDDLSTSDPVGDDLGDGDLSTNADSLGDGSDVYDPFGDGNSDF